MNSALAGSDIIMVAAGATSLDYWLMSQPAIKRPEQLGGRLGSHQSLWDSLQTLWQVTRSTKSV